MQEMSDEELESVEGGSSYKITLKKNLSNYYFYPVDSVTKTGTTLKETSQTNAKRKRLSTFIKGKKVTRLNEREYYYKKHTMMYVKLSPGGAKGYINENTLEGDSISNWDLVN